MLSDPESDDSTRAVCSKKKSDSEDFDDNEQIRWEQALKSKGPVSASYSVYQLTPLSTSSAWDEINTQLNIRLKGPDFLQSLCDEAHFVRSCLTKTSSALLNDLTQAKAALFCVKQITNKRTTEDLRVAFAKLLPHSLSHARPQWPELTTNIQILLTQHPTLCESLPSVTMQAITDYLRRLPSPIRSEKCRAAAGVVPKASPAPQHPPGIVPKSSTKATTGQKASTTPTSSTARRRSQKSSRPSQPRSTTDSKHRTPSQPQPVPRIFLVPSHSAQTQPSPSTSQNAPTSLLPPLSTGLKISNASQPQPTSRAPQSSARTQPSSNASWKPLTLSRTPEQPSAFESSTSAPAPSDISQRFRPFHLGKRKKGS